MPNLPRLLFRCLTRFALVCIIALPTGGFAEDRVPDAAIGPS